MQRRAFSCSLGGMVVTTILREVNGSKDRLMTIHPLAASTPPTLAASSWPRELAGIKFVDTRYTSLAIRTLASTSPGFLVNHAARTFYFGALIGNARGLAGRKRHDVLLPQAQTYGSMHADCPTLNASVEGARKSQIAFPAR